MDKSQDYQTLSSGKFAILFILARFCSNFTAYNIYYITNTQDDKEDHIIIKISINFVQQLTRDTCITG